MPFVDPYGEQDERGDWVSPLDPEAEGIELLEATSPLDPERKKASPPPIPKELENAA